MAAECVFSLSNVLWQEIKSVQFFLFPCESGSAEWQLTKILNDLEKRFIIFGELSYARVKNEVVRVSLRVPEKTTLDEILFGIEEAFTHSITLQMPAYLLSRKEKVLLEIERISSWNQTRIEHTWGDTLGITVLGSAAQVAKTKIDLFRMVEIFQGKEARSISSFISAKSIISQGGKVFFETKILSQNAFISGSISQDGVLARKKEENIARESFLVDSAKFAYSLIYFRNAIEDILMQHESYIELAAKKLYGVEITLASLSRVSLLEATARIKAIYTSIVSVKIKEISKYTTAKIFVFLTESVSIVIGESREIKKMLREIDLPCKLLIDMTLSAEDFICGKKNGKINKIAKESQCILAVKKEKSCFLSIKGRSSNVEFAFVLVEDEIPAEYSFYLHEKYHKRIIGYGGKTIQRLMKKHGVYIKFDSTVNSEHNVIIRTPQKNKESLLKMHKDVMKLAGELPSTDPVGICSSISYFDFYAFKFETYVLHSLNVQVFQKNQVEVKYYLLDKTKKIEHMQLICTIPEGYVIASLGTIEHAQLITPSFWKNSHSLSTYFMQDYGDVLFGKESLWKRKWGPRFTDTWNSISWYTNSHSKTQ